MKKNKLVRYKNIRLLLKHIIGIALLIMLLTLNACSKKTTNYKVTLKIWQTETDKEAVAELKNIGEEFKKNIKISYPNYDLDIDIQSIPWNSISQKITLALSNQTEPDIAHLEPFMFSSILNKGYLLPLDSLIEAIEIENKDTIFESVKNLQLFEGKKYGIAHAIGITGYSYRKDIMMKLGIDSLPKTWAQFIVFTKKMVQGSDNKLKVILPGADQFFIDQWFSELLVNNGGKLFEPVSYEPLLNSKESIETFQFIKELAEYIDPGWSNQSYLDQFNRLGRNEVSIVPVTYLRAVKSIENIVNNQRELSSIEATPNVFGLMEQPVGPSYNGKSISTIDCEPFVIFRSTEKKNVGDLTNRFFSEEFLKFFYLKRNYLEFTKKVPIHLTPIFKNMANDENYTQTPLYQRWKPWAEQVNTFLFDTLRVRPILMPDISEAGKKIPFLLEFQASRIISEAITVIINNKNADPIKIANIAQEKTMKLLKDLNYLK
ncbi:MAG: extracellular solute-binding protein [Ignavibacteriae bacterium]|nr:MAG: extracellular solute-binding protein [Ignavibacteriota bacterium]